MKLASLMLADYANVREGTLGVLGGFVDHLWRGEYPAPLGVHFVAVLSATAEEARSGHASSSFKFWCEEDGSGQPLFGGDGNLEGDLDDGRETSFPLVFDISTYPLEKPGSYVIVFELDGHEAGRVRFWSDALESAQQ